MDRHQSPPREPTIYDVAQAAGVAPSTVSRALSRPGRVSARTAEKVRSTAERLGYQRVTIAPALRPVPTRLLAVMVADIGNPLFVDVIRGAEETADAEGYTTLLFDTKESEEREGKAAENFVEAVDGLILTSPRLSDSGIRMIAKQRPVIVLNRVVKGLPSVITDGARGSRRAAEHLGEIGHREVTYLSGPETSWADGMRWRGLQEAGLELELRARRIGPFPPTLDGGRRAIQRWAEQPTTGVVAFNDMMAIGFIRGLRAQGLSVPEDVSVIGFDNSQTGALTLPSLTSVASPVHYQGVMAVRNLVAIIGGARPEAEPLLLPTKLVVRGSTAPPRAGELQL